MAKTPGPKRVPNGEVAERLIRNIIAVRGVRWRSLRQLSRALAAAGHPIAELGVARMLAGNRRIDVDDLVAFSRVLDIPVTDLLFGDVHVSVTYTE